MSALHLNALRVRRADRNVLHGVSLTLAPGDCVGLIGPNGAGKTTLMRAALGLIAHEGQSSLAQMSPARRARAAAWLPQTREIAWPLPVRDLVALGRLPHRAGGLGVLAPADRAAVDRALAQTGLGALADRPATALSGGEQARVLLARALAQETPLILADEPVAGLDPAHQIGAMQLLRARADAGGAVLVALHDLGLAARQCTRLVLLVDGRIMAEGPPAEVLTPETMRAAFGVRIWAGQTPLGPAFQVMELWP